MQIAALNPKYLSSDDVDAEYKEHEKEILLVNHCLPGYGGRSDGSDVYGLGNSICRGQQ